MVEVDTAVRDDGKVGIAIIYVGLTRNVLNLFVV